MPGDPKTAWWMVGVAVAPTVALLIAVLLDWSGPGVVVGSLFVVFVAPGLACRVIFRQPVVNLVDVAMTVAVSIGATILLGLWLNALKVSLTRSHWAEALSALVISTCVAGLVSSPPRLPADPVRRVRFQLKVSSAIAVGCLTMTALGAGVVAWVSQQHWLLSQHFTELYARPAADRERVYVHNHEGQSVGYRMVIRAAGAAPSVVQFSLASGATWSDDVVVRPAAASPTAPLLRVSLFRGADPTVYRQIRLP